METDIDTGNYQFVGVQGSEITVMMPQRSMTKRQALLHAAWLVALAEEEDGQFDTVLKAVQNT